MWHWQGRFGKFVMSATYLLNSVLNPQKHFFTNVAGNKQALDSSLSGMVTKKAIIDQTQTYQYFMCCVCINKTKQTNKKKSKMINLEFKCFVYIFTNYCLK